MVGIIKYGKIGSHTMDFNKIDWFKLHNDILKIAGSQKTLDEFMEKMKNDKMSKCKTNTKHLNISNDICKGNKKEGVKLVEKKSKSKPEADESEGKIINAKDAWITVTDKAVFINISVEDVNKIPVSEWTNKDTEETKERIVLVGSRSILEKLLSGEKKGVPLAYFKEE